MKSGTLVVLEQRGGELKRSSLEALATGIGIESRRGGDVCAVLIGHELQSALEQLKGTGLPRVFVVRAEELEHYSTEGWRKAACAAARECDAGLVLTSATTLGRDLAPAVAGDLGAGYAAECTSLELEDGTLTARRPVYAGKAIATVSCVADRFVVGLRPNVFPATFAEGGGDPEVSELSCDVGGIRARVKEVSEASKDAVDVAEADVIVAGGRGVGGPEGFAPLEELAGVLGAAVGASRAVVDLGWRPHSEQVGQTGKVVSPKLYVACGISGAIQHLAGMRTSKVIVAINKDPNAPIFKVADYGIEGDLFEVVPALTEALRKALAS